MAMTDGNNLIKERIIEQIKELLLSDKYSGNETFLSDMVSVIESRGFSIDRIAANHLIHKFFKELYSETEYKNISNNDRLASTSSFVTKISDDFIKQGFDTDYFQKIKDAKNRVERAAIIGNEKASGIIITKNRVMLQLGSEIIYNEQKVGRFSQTPLYVEVNEFVEAIDLSTVKNIIVEENLETFFKFHDYEWSDDLETKCFVEDELAHSIIVHRIKPSKNTPTIYANTLIEAIYNHKPKIKVIASCDLDCSGFDWAFKLKHVTHIVLPVLPTNINEACELFNNYGKAHAQNTVDHIENCKKNPILVPYINVIKQTEKMITQEAMQAHKSHFRLKLFCIQKNN